MTKTPRSLWLTNGIFVTQNRRRDVIKGSLCIENGRIQSLRRGAPSRTRGIRVVDLGGLAVFPGFVQTHVHLCQTLMRNRADDVELLDWLKKKIWPYEASLTARRLSQSAWIGIRELLSTGTTCVLDMGTVRHTEVIFEAVLRSGIRANVGKCLMDNPKTCPPGLREKTSTALQEAERLFRKWNGRENDRIRASFAPRFAISCTRELLSAVASRADALGALIHTHASENLKEIAFVKSLTGMNNIEYLHSLGLLAPHTVLAHCVWVNRKEMGLLKTTGTHVAHCPSSNLKLASGIAPVLALRDRGINVSLGADGAPCNNNLNMLQEMRLAALIQKPGHGPKAIRAQEALDMATRAGAKALQWEDSIGSLEVGKSADLVAIDLQTDSNRAADASPEALASALVYSTHPHHVRMTMVAGRAVYSSRFPVSKSREPR